MLDVYVCACVGGAVGEGVRRVNERLGGVKQRERERGKEGAHRGTVGR